MLIDHLNILSARKRERERDEFAGFISPNQPCTFSDLIETLPNIITTVDSRYSANKISAYLAHTRHVTYSQKTLARAFNFNVTCMHKKVKNSICPGNEVQREREIEREANSQIRETIVAPCLRMCSVDIFPSTIRQGKCVTRRHRRCRLLTYRRARSVNHAGNWRRTEARVNTRRGRRRAHERVCTRVHRAPARTAARIARRYHTLLEQMRNGGRDSGSSEIPVCFDQLWHASSPHLMRRPAHFRQESRTTSKRIMTRAPRSPAP